MRLWHYSILNYLPKAQLVSQWRECVCIAKSIYENGTPNHILVNRIMDYPISEFNTYCNHVLGAMLERGYKVSSESIDKLEKYVGFVVDSGDRAKCRDNSIFCNWHDEEYYRVCMFNLYEKWWYAKGKSTLTSEEWNLLNRGYYFHMGRWFNLEKGWSRY